MTHAKSNVLGISIWKVRFDWSLLVWLFLSRSESYRLTRISRLLVLSVKIFWLIPQLTSEDVEAVRTLLVKQLEVYECWLHPAPVNGGCSAG